MPKVKKIYMRTNEARLPVEYQEVEYIDTTGTQWINTGLFMGNNIQIELKFEVHTALGENQSAPLFGSYTTNNPSGVYSLSGYAHLTPLNSKWYYGTNGSEYNVSGYNDTVGANYEIVYNNSSSQIVVNGNVIATANNIVGYTGSTVSISRRGNYSANYYMGKWRYYYFRMYNKTTGQYERNMIPCYRKSDSVIGMYDLVNNTFYTNNGTGTFTKGNDIDTMVMVEHQVRPAGGSSWQPNANTLLYLPFTDDILDHSGNNHTITAQSGTNYTFTTFSNGAKCIHLNPNGGGTYFKVTPINSDVIWNWNTSATWAYKIADEQQNTGTDTWARGGCFAYNTSCHMCEISWVSASGYNSGLFKIPGGYELSGPSGTTTTYDSSDVRATSSTPHSVVFTFDASTKTLKRYLDGTLFYETVFTGSLSNVPNQLCIWKGLYGSDKNRTLRGKTAHIVYELGVWDNDRIQEYCNII